MGKLFNFPLRLAVKRDEEWDRASKSGGFVSIFPTGDMTPDFLHSLGHFRSFADGLLRQLYDVPTMILVRAMEYLYQVRRSITYVGRYCFGGLTHRD